MTRLRNSFLRSLKSFNRLQWSLLALVVGLGMVYLTVARQGHVEAAQRLKASDDGVWQPVSRKGLSRKPAADVPAQALALQLDSAALSRKLSSVMRETSNSLDFSQTVVQLPLPSGEYVSFRVEESPVLDDELLKRFPEIKSYRGVGVDDASITMRADWTPQGFHALVLTPQHTYSIFPAHQSTTSEYVTFDTGDVPIDQKTMQCGADDSRIVRIGNGNGAITAISVGSSRRNYRIAIAATWEYCNTYGGGTVAGTVSSLNTWLNSLNAIYERELNIRLTLVNATNVLYCSENGHNSGSDPFSNGASGSMLSEVRPVLRDNVGASNYDIGHVLGTGGSGVAWLGVVCGDGNINGDSLGPAKGGGVSNIAGSLGSSGALNMIMHEIGHQFGAAHSFNGTTGNCGGGNRSSGSAVEPGAGTTIMSYAGLCGSDNVSGGSDLRFHAWSFAQITNFAATRTCHSSTNTGNTAPTVNGGSNYTIPAQTPFELIATGNDADAADVANLTYAWEQIDVGGSSYGNPPYTDAGDPANSTRPLFRSYGPTASPARTFPALSYILNNANTAPPTVGSYQSADFLSSINRSLNFRVVVRDQRGGVTDDDVSLTVNANAGPFLVTAPNAPSISWTGGTQQTVSWSVNNTNAAPINCANVRITLSTDGGQTFPYTLASSTPNDGSETITVPNGVISSSARVRVQAVGNVFFDISDANFTLTPGGTCPAVSGINPSAGAVGTVVTITGTNFSGVSAVRFGSANATFNVVSNTSIQATVPVGASGGPITVSKSGCSDIQTAAFALCSSPAVNLQVDDGSLEHSVGYSSGTSYFVNRLTPGGYPATVSTVTVAVNRPAGTAIDVIVGTNTDGNSTIDNTSFQAVPATVAVTNGFMTVSVPTVTITSGDFVVGYRITAVGGTYPGTYDNSSGSQQRSYASNTGTGFQTMDGLGYPGNLGIRAAVFVGSCSTASVTCPTVSGINPSSGTYSGTVTISGSGFTGVTGVSFANNLPASFTVNSDSQITATVPTGAVTGSITLSKSGCNAVQTSSFTVTPPLYNPTTTGVFRPTNGNLYLKNQNTTGFADLDLVYGLPGDQPVVGDWNGDGIDTIGIYRNGIFYLRNSNTTGFADIIIAFGSAGDQPVAGDWNGDGIDTIGIYRNGSFFLRNSLTAGGPDLTITVGSPGDIGIAGDWNGDGIDTVGVFRPTNGNLYLRNTNTTGVADLTLVYGLPGDQPVVGDWDGNGTDTIGVKRGQFFYLRNSNTSGVAEIAFVLGLSSDVPIAGDWDGQP